MPNARHLVPFFVVVLGCSLPTKHNDHACCTSEADCDAVGLTPDFTCKTGLTCQHHECIPPCDADSNCSGFSDTPVCQITTGTCVECADSSTCSADAPFCDSGSCRACALDSECGSLACGDDGRCIEEAAIVYIDPMGDDGGACTLSAPCRTLATAIAATNDARSHIVLARGTYDLMEAFVDSQFTAASRIAIHGGGATLNSTGTETLLIIAIPSTIKDLRLVATADPNNSALLLSRATTLERVSIQASHIGLLVAEGSPLTATDLDIETVGTDTIDVGMDIRLGASVHLDRGRVHGGFNGITAASGTSVDINNLLVFGCRGLALNMQSTSGTVAFSTVADSGASTTSGARDFLCSMDMTVRSSIIWDPASGPTRPAIGGICALVSTIAGSAAVPGAINLDPQFVDESAHDYHLGPNSPAKDMVDSGPATDFEGDPRPSGMRFDIGADESN